MPGNASTAARLRASLAKIGVLRRPGCVVTSAVAIPRRRGGSSPRILLTLPGAIETLKPSGRAAGPSSWPRGDGPHFRAALTYGQLGCLAMIRSSLVQSVSVWVASRPKLARPLIGIWRGRENAMVMSMSHGKTGATTSDTVLKAT